MVHSFIPPYIWNNFIIFNKNNNNNSSSNNNTHTIRIRVGFSRAGQSETAVRLFPVYAEITENKCRPLLSWFFEEI